MNMTSKQQELSNGVELKNRKIIAKYKNIKQLYPWEI